MTRKPTDDEVYWAIAVLAAHAPTNEMRRNAVLLLSKFTTVGMLSRENIRAGILGAPETGESVPKHRAPKKIEETEESKALVVAAQRHLTKKKKVKYNDPIYKCLQDYESCRESGNSKTLCFTLNVLCMARAFVPKNISGISIGKGEDDS